MAYEVSLFGKHIQLRDNLCTCKKGEIINGELYYNLYISITDVCLANCKFCNNNTKQKCTKSNIKLDLDKLEAVIKELKNKVELNRISITGGEPLLDISQLNRVLNLIFEVCGKNQMVTINTNGINLAKIFELDSLDLLEGIHVSRHHFDDTINDEIFGFKTAHIQDIENVQNKLKNKKLLRLNCLLIKDYIDSKDQVKSYLEIASKLNIFRVGFVGLMSINDYSKEHYIEYKDVFEDFDESFQARQLFNKDVCDCLNGVYMAQNGNLVQYYARVVRKLNPELAGQFNYSFDNHFNAGFNNKIF